ncbi:MAG TPA: 5'-methylthioadenosine/S-adenosylhomocysteine nucleosidase [Streptosporangiaceae bacterium]|jgi:adenosylhomocysteine nucleosidase|nr:5'-methylthioadenosine/S-adenosylhomocysteine nucleosidase [Streptosporangiaceae bacterium]
MTRINHGVFGTDQASITFNGGNVAIGRNARVDSAASSHGGPGQNAWNIGVITALSVEMREVVAMLRRLGHTERRTYPGGQRFYESHTEIGTTRLKIVAIQALSPGQRSTPSAYQSLREHYSPAYVVLLGIAGGVHADLHNGDVIIAQEVIYYDLRKETPHGVRRRGQSHPVPATVLHSVNDFFADHETPLRLADEKTRQSFQVLSGPIGSGEAVVADRDAEIRAYISSYNDKTLALETEAGGLAQAFYEGVSGDNAPHGWLVIRGISDLADTAKDDDFHVTAARRASQVLKTLLPYLIAAP